MIRALVVEDEAGYRSYMRRLLEMLLKCEPILAENAKDGFGMAVKERPQLILVDWCLRGHSGLELVRDLRAESRTRHIAVVMMSSIRETVEDEFRALDAGADRFFVKAELEPGADKGATLKRHLAALILLGAKRAASAESRTGKIHQLGSLRIDPARAEASVDGQALRLGRKEFELLEFFARHPDVIHSAERIWDSVWGTARTGNWGHTLASTLSALRRNLGFEWSARLVNVKTLGYRLLSADHTPSLSRPR